MMAELHPFGHFAPNSAQKALLTLAALPLLRRGFFRRIFIKLIPLIGQSTIDLRRSQAHYRLTPHNNVAERGILLNPEYQKPSLDFLRAHLPMGGTLVDCGANVGQFSLVGGEAVGASGKVLSIEATATMAERLRNNIALSDMAGRISVNQCAVGGEEGTIRFTVNTRDGALSRASESGETEIPMRPLKALLDEAGITHVDLLKIDVEGMEDQVLSAFFRDAPAKLKPKHIIIEDELSDNWEKNVSSLLTECGYVEAKTRTHGNAFYSLKLKDKIDG